VPIARYYTPEEFSNWQKLALNLGFKKVAAGPLVRSSYLAEDLYESIKDFNRCTT
jgi:lipoic acid synthetase